MAIASFLFILIGILWELAKVPGAYVLLSPQEEEVHTSSWKHRCTHSAAHSLKRFKSLSAIILLCQCYCWIRKNTNKEFNCVVVFIIRPSTTLKFQFVFGFNKCLWPIFSLLIFENFWLYIGYGCVNFDFTIFDDLSYLLAPMPMKKWSAKTTKYIPKCWEKSVKRNSNLNVMNFFITWSTFSINWLYMVQTFLKIHW